MPAPGLATANLGALRPPHKRKKTLSPREREMLVLVGRGFECPQIAAALWISHHTVRNHMKAALRYFGTRTAAGTVSAALVACAISLDDLRPGIAEPITLYPSGQGKAAHTLRGLLR